MFLNSLIVLWTDEGESPFYFLKKIPLCWQLGCEGQGTQPKDLPESSLGIVSVCDTSRAEGEIVDDTVKMTTREVRHVCICAFYCDAELVRFDTRDANGIFSGQFSSLSVQ